MTAQATRNNSRAERVVYTFVDPRYEVNFPAKIYFFICMLGGLEYLRRFFYSSHETNADDFDSDILNNELLLTPDYSDAVRASGMLDSIRCDSITKKQALDVQELFLIVEQDESCSRIDDGYPVIQSHTFPLAEVSHIRGGAMSV